MNDTTLEVTVCIPNLLDQFVGMIANACMMRMDRYRSMKEDYTPRSTYPRFKTALEETRDHTE